MTFGFLNLLMLLGLAGLLIPPLIHLLNRRRYDVVDWGAMQFLQVSETTRRRLLIEEILLMFLRMGLIGVLVLALASPYLDIPALAGLGRANRDVVVVFDGSYSMGFANNGPSAHERAQEWAGRFLDGLAAGDTVAILQAKQQVVPVLEPTSDLERAREQVANLPPPAGGCDWPGAVQAALKLLEASKRPQREVVLVGDGQQFGWSDETSLLRWELLAHQLRDRGGLLPRVWVVNVDPHRPADPPNWSLAPLRASRVVASAGQQVTFRTALEVRGQEEYRPPRRVRLEIDGQPVGEVQPPSAARLEKGQVPLTFTHRFAAPGSHLVSLVVEPDPPPAERPPGYVVKDHLPGDNRRDFAVEVLHALPVLLVDGETRADARTRDSDFLRDALSPARDRTPVVRARVVSADDLSADLLAGDLFAEPGTRPRVLVLCNVPRLSAAQQEAVAGFLEAGGGVLVAPGEAADAKAYNAELYRGGQGWLPARLVEPVGEEARPEEAATPLASSFFHPALELFRDVPVGGLADARFPRYWKLTTPASGAAAVPVALLTSGDPLLVERGFRGGRVLVSAVPLNNAWRTNVIDLPAFAPLVHELVYYLAGARSADNNLQPGQPLRYQAERDEATEGLTLETPDGETKPLVFEGPAGPAVHRAEIVRRPQGPLVVYEGARETGVYRLKTPDGRTVPYVVQPDRQESDLTAATDADRAKVAGLVPMTYQNDAGEMATALVESTQRQEVWWWFLLGVIGLLCSEVWMTRRMVKQR